MHFIRRYLSAPPRRRCSAIPTAVDEVLVQALAAAAGIARLFEESRDPAWIEATRLVERCWPVRTRCFRPRVEVR